MGFLNGKIEDLYQRTPKKVLVVLSVGPVGDFLE